MVRGPGNHSVGGGFVDLDDHERALQRNEHPRQLLAERHRHARGRKPFLLIQGNADAVARDGGDPAAELLGGDCAAEQGAATAASTSPTTPVGTHHRDRRGRIIAEPPPGVHPGWLDIPT